MGTRLEFKIRDEQKVNEVHRVVGLTHAENPPAELCTALATWEVKCARSGREPEIDHTLYAAAKSFFDLCETYGQTPPARWEFLVQVELFREKFEAWLFGKVAC